MNYARMAYYLPDHCCQGTQRCSAKITVVASFGTLNLSRIFFCGDSSYLCPTLRRNWVFPSLPPCIFTMIFVPGQSPTAPHSACCSPSLFSAPAQAQHNQVPTSHTASGDACHGRRPISLEQLDCELDCKMNEVRQHSSCPLSTR